MNNELIVAPVRSRTDEIRSRVESLRNYLITQDSIVAKREFPEYFEASKRMEGFLETVEELLVEIPPIDVAVLGPSRHGKSTLLNALAAQELLPTSDIKPCTASLVKMIWANEWAVTVKFVKKDQLKNDWANAVKDAKDELAEQKQNSSENDDPAFLKNVLQRFIQLFKVDPELPATELIEKIETATIPGETAILLGQSARVNAKTIDGMRNAIKKYLSTSDSYWTIVEHCEIAGPFENWHPSLGVVDLPGTNDTDPQRTEITNSVRDSATAVAIVTSDSNLGRDIEAWLRHSSVLSNFLEATKQRRQRLFIIRTKLDSYHPEIDEKELENANEEDEAQLYHDALEHYKQEQTATYRSMLRDIAGPKLPFGNDETSNAKRTELLTRIDDIPVFYVSALAHEVFAGRFHATSRTKRQLSEYFDDDIEKTGVSELRAFLVQIASEYLADNFYTDLEDNLESEARRLAGVFRKSIAMLKAESAGGKQALQGVVQSVRGEVLPWFAREVGQVASTFHKLVQNGANGITDRLRQTEALSSRRMEDKVTIWSGYHWASLRAAARKGGMHVTGRGQSIDFSEDICSVLIDDILVAWTHYRDDLISTQISDTTQSLVDELNVRLQQFQNFSDVPEVSAAIKDISDQLYGLTDSQRLEMLRLVNDKIRELESIRRPAYKIAAEEMQSLLGKIEKEFGAGCSFRVREILAQDAPAAIDRTRARIRELVKKTLADLAVNCGDALGDFGKQAGERLNTSVTHVSNYLIEQDTKSFEHRVSIANNALLALPLYD